MGGMPQDCTRSDYSLASDSATSIGAACLCLTLCVTGGWALHPASASMLLGLAPCVTAASPSGRLTATLRMPAGAAAVRDAVGGHQRRATWLGQACMQPNRVHQARALPAPARAMAGVMSADLRQPNADLNGTHYIFGRGRTANVSIVYPIQCPVISPTPAVVLADDDQLLRTCAAPSRTTIGAPHH